MQCFFPLLNQMYYINNNVLYIHLVCVFVCMRNCKSHFIYLFVYHHVHYLFDLILLTSKSGQMHTHDFSNKFFSILFCFVLFCIQNYRTGGVGSNSRLSPHFCSFAQFCSCAAARVGQIFTH